jgi:hypothetical protein
VNTHPINPGRSVCLKVWDIRFINQSLQICIYIIIYIHIYRQWPSSVSHFKI